MKLIRTELKRLRWRGINTVALFALLGVVLLMTFSSYNSSKPPTAQMIAEQEESFLWELEYWEENHEADYQECLAGEEAEREYLIAAGEEDLHFSWGCEWFLEKPDKDSYMGFWQETFVNYVDNTLSELVIILLAIALFLGASFTAGEINSGSMGTWLTFEPRRTRVYYSKSGALFLWGTVVGLATVSLAVLLAWLVFSINGVGELAAKQWTDTLLMVLRSAPLIGIVAALGGSLGIILRHTAAVAVAAFAWVSIAESLIMYGSWRALTPWLITPNVQGWIKAGTDYWYTVCSGTGADYICEPLDVHHSGLRSFFFIVCVTLLVSAIGNLIFRRRDIQ